MAILGVPWLIFSLECQDFELLAMTRQEWKGFSKCLHAEVYRATHLISLSCDESCKHIYKDKLIYCNSPNSVVVFDKSLRTSTVLERWRRKVVGGGLVAKSGPTLETPWCVVCQAPLSLGILQERILEWVVISFSSVSYQPRNGTWVSCTAGRQILYRQSYEGGPKGEGRQIQFVSLDLERRCFLCVCVYCFAVVCLFFKQDFLT